MRLAVISLFGSPMFFVVAVLVALALLSAIGAAVFEIEGPQVQKSRFFINLKEKEKDIASSLGIEFRNWVIIRISAIVGCTLIGFLSGVFIMILVGLIFGLFGVTWMLSGRAGKRRLLLERSFLGEIRNLRARMDIAQQSLDVSLRELGRQHGDELDHLLEPLVTMTSLDDALMEVGKRSRSPIIDSACSLLMFARGRNQDILIQLIDEVLLEIAERQLEIQEDGMHTLTQQRAVTAVMVLLSGFFFAVIVRQDAFRPFYQSLLGQITLGVSIIIFVSLIALLGYVGRPEKWTRWELDELRKLQERILNA